jgi:hypothetical protein
MGDNTLDYANFSFAENGYSALDTIGNNNIGTNVFNGYGQSTTVTDNTAKFNQTDPKKIDPLCINSNSCYGKTMEQKLNSGQQQVIGKLGNYIVSGISQGKGTTTDAIVLYDTKTKNTIIMTQDEFFVYNQLAQTDMEKFNNLLAVAQMQSNTTHTAQNAVSGYNPDGKLSGMGDAWKQYVSSGEILLDLAGGSAGTIEKKIAGSVTKNVDDFATIYSKAPSAKAEIDTLADTIASKYDGTVAKAPIKTEERAQQKINSDYDGDATQIKDLARNTIIVDSSKIDSVVADLTSNGANVKTISSTTDELGYSGINAKIQTNTGITAEIQVNTPEMIFAKESETNARKLLGDEAYNQIAAKTPVQGGLGHTLYEEWRVIPNKNSGAAKVLAEKSRQYYNTVRSANAD